MQQKQHKQKTFFVKVLKCERKGSWYEECIGDVFEVRDNLFPPDYTLIIHKKGIYPMISFNDAETVTPTKWQLLLNFLRKKKQSIKNKFN